MSNSHYKSYKHEELEMVFVKLPIVCKLGDLGEARSMYSQTNASTDKNCTTAVHSRSLAFMATELIIKKIIISISRNWRAENFDVFAVLMIFITILNPDQSHPFQNDLKNIPNKVTSNMEADFKQELTLSRRRPISYRN